MLAEPGTDTLPVVPNFHAEPVRGGYPPLEFLGVPGLERMRAGDAGLMRPPPIHHLFGLRPVDSGLRTATFTMPVSPWLEAGAGLYQAGTSALVADAPLGSAILSMVDAGTFGVTSELSVNYLRPVTRQSRELRARATTIDVGRSLGLSEAIVEDARGSVIAYLTSRYFLRRLDPPPPPFEPKPVELPVYETPDPYLRPLPDELRDQSHMLTRSGLEYFHGVRAGEIPPPPFSVLFGCRITEAEEGRFASATVASEWLHSPARTIYGGVIAYLLDSAMTGAISTTLRAGDSAAPLDMKVQYLRPGIADGREVLARAEVLHRGKTMAVTRAELLNPDGKQIAIATGSSMVLEGRPWQSIAVADEATVED